MSKLKFRKSVAEVLDRLIGRAIGENYHQIDIAANGVLSARDGAEAHGKLYSVEGTADQVRELGEGVTRGSFARALRQGIDGIHRAAFPGSSPPRRDDLLRQGLEVVSSVKDEMECAVRRGGEWGLFGGKSLPGRCVFERHPVLEPLKYGDSCKRVVNPARASGIGAGGA